MTHEWVVSSPVPLGHKLATTSVDQNISAYNSIATQIDNLVNRNMKVKNEEGGGSRKEGSWRGCQNFNYSFHICYRTTS